MQSNRFASIPIDTIARLGDLTKREIQVLLFLHSCRNASSGRCYPSRSTIAEGTGLARPHVTVAIAGLEAKKWIEINGDGSFLLTDPRDLPTFTNLVTNPDRESYQFGNSEVTNSVTDDDEKPVTNSVTPVTNSVTKVTNLVTAYIRNSLTEKNKELTEKGNARNGPKPAKKKPVKKPSRIPDPFPLTDAMIAWQKEHCPAIIDLAAAHDDFVEYWTNHPDTKKAYASNWVLRWQKGCRLRERWDLRDDPNRAKAAARRIAEAATADNADEGVATPGNEKPAVFVSAHDRAVWDQVRQRIAETLPAEVVRTWFDQLSFDGLDGVGRLRLRGSDVVVDWVRSYYTQKIADALDRSGYSPNAFVFEVDAGNAGKDRAA